ncbi:MAG: ComEC/Rec2 family competence protein [Cyclobacteriaceae bacterium]
MLKWIPYSMVRVAVFFTAGVLAAIYLPDLLSFRLALVISAILVSAYFPCRFFLRGRALNVISGLVGLLAVAFLGYAHLLLKTDSHKANHLLSTQDRIESYSAIVRSSPESKSKSWKVEVEVIAIKTSQWQPIKGKVLLYVSKKGGDVTWRYGDQIIIQGGPQLLKPPANPGEFDFKRFLSFKNIYHQQFVLPDQVKWISATERKGFIYYSHEARSWASQKLNQYISGEQEQAIAAALVLGVTEGIDTDLINAYSASGALHVLSVSGLHVGIIYVILLFLLKPLNRYSWSRWVVAAISLVSLWGFAFVTGLSPSVLRAVTMFSFVAIARPFGMRTNIYNTLAASAFVLLLYNPYLIMSVGFQLSYLAVLGIVYLQRPIYNLWEVENQVGDWVWQITCVSIAAQIATFSLGLLYFHQFPVYFLISNLFVIPLSTAVLVLGVLLLAISFIPPLAITLGKLVSWLIYFLNGTVLFTEKLPFSLINEIHITTFQCWLLMGVLISFIFLFKFRRAKWLYTAFAFAILFSTLQWIHFQESVNKSQLVVYAVSGHSAIEQIEQGSSVFYTDSSLLNDEERTRFHIRPNRLQHGVAEVKPSLISSHNINIGLFYWQGKSVAFLANRETKLPQNLVVDFLIVAHNSFPIYKKERLNLKIGKLIIDGSNSRSYTKKLTKFAQTENIPVHSVLEQGAFILKD